MEGKPILLTYSLNKKEGNNLSGMWWGLLERNGKGEGGNGRGEGEM